MDQDIPEEYTKRPKCYGNSQVSESEIDVLTLSPKYAVFEEVKVMDCKAEVEKGITKYRWSYMAEKSETQVGGLKKSDLHFIQDKRLDFRNMKATDMPFNKRVVIPNAIKQEEEVKIQMLKQRLEEVTIEYVMNDNKRNMLSNLSATQKEGLKTLKERKKNQEVVIFQTDKTNSFSVDTLDNYRVAGLCHTENDDVVDDEQRKHLEAVMNAHGIMWSRFLNAGENTNNHQRIKDNMLNENCEVAPLYTLRKDHKKEGIDYTSEVTGPPTRPICGAESCYNGKMSYLLSTILAPIVEESETNCRSTEEMLAEINEVNEKVIEEDVVMGSADVKALYPSLNIADTINVVTEMFMESNIELIGIDQKELALYISLNRTEREIDEIGISNYCPKRRSNRGIKPSITASGTKEKKEERYGPWIFPKRKPSKGIVKVMVKEAIKIGLSIVLNNHIYTYDGTNRIQKDGGAIGLQLTGVIADIFMTWWDKQFLSKLQELGLVRKMYKRYVDDINQALRGNVRGKKYMNGGLEEDEDKRRGDENKENDEVMMELVKAIGDEIHPSIKLEVDYPSKYPDRKLPILDIKVWIEERERDGKRVIMHEYYEKQISSKWVIHAKTALPMGSKRTILTQQVLRILLNCSKEITWQRKAYHVSEWMKKVQLSGYNKKFRYEIVDSAIKAYKKIYDEDLNKVKPIYRQRDYRKKERKETKMKKKKDWYEKGGYKSVIFVPSTPESTLKRKYDCVIKETGMRFKVVEKAGKQLKRILQSSNPFQKEGCNDALCFVCRNGNKGNCRRNDIKYHVECQRENCGKIYHGETSKNAYTRGREHEADYRLHSEKSHMWKHCVLDHDGEEQTFTMHIDKTFRKDPLLRQITEAIAIQDTGEERRMNSRAEWRQPRVPRIRIGTYHT